MKKIVILIITIGLFLVGCSSEAAKLNSTNGIVEEFDSTKERVYSTSWDGIPIIVKQRNTNEDYEIINEITDTDEVNKLIKALENADWQENIQVDITPPDYRFSWNSFNHGVWINQEYERLELLIEGQSNYGSLTADSSKIIFEILTGKKLKDYE
jgi:uncharacterized protein YcfL